MSLILEALRKSEAERRRGLAPDVAMELPPAPASRPRTITTWLLPALAVLALLVLAGWWARRGPANSASTATPTEAANETAQSTPEANPQIPSAMPRIEPRPAIVQAPATTTAAPTPPSPTTASPVTSTTAATRPAPSQSTPLPVQPAPIPPPPPPASEISNNIAQLPSVKLSMLMWDDVPSKRFVILNGQRMAEGDRHGAITVIAIERGGVVVESDGTKARVPLP